MFQNFTVGIDDDDDDDDNDDDDGDDDDGGDDDDLREFVLSTVILPPAWGT